MTGVFKVLYINNDGQGFSGEVEVQEGTCVRDFFHDQKGAEAKAADFLIRVNREPVQGSYVLKPGDRIVVAPTKLEGQFADKTKGFLGDKPAKGKKAPKASTKAATTKASTKGKAHKVTKAK